MTTHRRKKKLRKQIWFSLFQWFLFIFIDVLLPLKYSQWALLTCSKLCLHRLLPFRCKQPLCTTTNSCPIFQWAPWSFCNYNLRPNVSRCAIAFSTRGIDAPSLDMRMHTSRQLRAPAVTESPLSHFGSDSFPTYGLY